MLRTGPKTVVVILQYHASTDTSQFWVVWWGYVFKITVSPCYPYTASGADCSGSVVWAVGSNKSPWWLCPSLGILCSDWESGVSVARSWGRDAWPAARGQGSQGLISKHGFLTRARLQCSQLVQSLSSSHTRRRRAKTWTEYTEFQSHTYGENMCMHMKKWTEGSASQHKIWVLHTCPIIWVWLSDLENTYITCMQIQCLAVNSVFLSLRAFITMPVTSDNQRTWTALCFFPVC